MASSDSDPRKAEATPALACVDDLAAPLDGRSRARLSFPVVGIGASAGGVEALQRLFTATPASGGMAYVVIQHLSSEHESSMVDILSRCASMPVHQIEEGARIEPDNVYVIRPGRTITLRDGRLRMGESLAKRSHRCVVDDFFRSLAREQRERAIAVVLSGTGASGTAGAQAIRAAGGLCLAQDPETTDFPGMPQSLIRSGCADQTLQVEDMPAVLRGYTGQALAESAPGPAPQKPGANPLEQQLFDMLQILRARTGHDFSPFKSGMVLRRVQRRMGLLGTTALESYGTRLRESSAEVTALANDLMINVTGFFRDCDAWEVLRESVIRPLVSQRETGEAIRAWVTPCASGEEAYSLAMLLAEEAERARKAFDVKIIATDTADKALARARAGEYPSGIERDLSAERLERFFDPDGHTYRIKRKLREQVVFAPQDVLRDPPFSGLDLVTCRNLLIYLNPEAQRRTLALLHFALREGGHLLLGNSEFLTGADALFEVVSKRWRIFRRAGPACARVELPAMAPRIAEIRSRSAAPLRQAREEAISIDEKLQSINEELEATKEELQSVNEELVTVNTQLQTKLLELESLNNDLDHLLSNTHIPVLFLDTELKVRRFTPAINDLLGLISADVGRPVAHLAQKFSGVDLIADAAQVLAKLVPLESEVHSHSGRWYLRRTLCYRTEDDRIAGVVVTFADISARKQAEQAIEVERVRLHAVIEQLPAAVLLVEAPSGTLLYGNPRAASLFNQPYPLPFIGSDWTAVYSGSSGSHGDRRPYEAQEWPLARALATGEAVLDEELELVRADSVRATLSMSAAPIRDPSGRTFAAVAAFRDITDRKTVEERLHAALLAAQQLRAVAERAHSAQDEFISTVSHELRTPLNTIRLWSRMFLDGQVSDHDVIKGGGMIDRAAFAQQRLIDDLLDVSRMAAGQLRLALREAPLLPALRSAIDGVRPIAASRNIALTVDLDAGVGIVRADPDRIQQVLWNLLSNAVKFTPDGGRIEVRARRDDGTVEIEVSDTGCGIRAAFLPHVFERFRQGEPGAARRYGGLGLGLSIARQLAELHGGTIAAHSEGEGRGAHFRVLLPLEPRSGSQSEACPERVDSAPSTLARLDVLVVEDDLASRETTSQMLEQRGAGVRQASSAAEARAAIETRGPDVIVADIGMPEEDGYALLRGLRRAEQEQRTPRVPAIAVTAFAGSEVRERALTAGFDEYLPKPVDPQRLVTVIARLAAKRVAAREY